VVVLVAAFVLAAAAANADALRVEPARVHLIGSDASAQVVVTELNAAGTSQDRTRECSYESLDPRVAVISKDGSIRARADGSTTIAVRRGELRQELSVEVSDTADARPIGFVSQIEPILSRYGCNSGGCHGKATGQNGFRLSLLGFDTRFDHSALVTEARGRRVFPAAPEKSLMLLKPTASIPHGGGRRFAVGSPDYRTIVRWIRQGMPYDVPDEPELASIEVSPRERAVASRRSQQLRVVAHYGDGRAEDVTRLAQYQSNSADLATVTESGLVETLAGVGDAAIMVRYGGQVDVARLTMPREGAPVAWQPPASESSIDKHLFAKLKALNLAPSPQCSDDEFIRRATLDICGRLPTPEELTAFEADASVEKRSRLVDRLLVRPEYADYFAMKWSTILRNQRGVFGEASRPTTLAFHTWIRQAIAENMPYDRFARAILAAKGDPASNPAVAWYRVKGFGEENKEQLVEDAAQLFLGMRIQCARCHHHPFERWSQDDYYGFASFFARVGKKPSSDPFAPRVFVRASGKAAHPASSQEYEPKALAGPQFAELGPRDDPRDRLVDWMREHDNSYFARALVNRYWKHFFGRGLVEPEDDLRVTNPASSPALLDALSKEFVTSGFDLKALVRTIAISEAYGLSSLPNEVNGIDRQNHSRFYSRRLAAEVLLDAIDVVTGSHERYAGLPSDYRAVQLPDEGFGSEFLEAFGRPKRESVCECERTSEPNLAQRLHLLNSEYVESKVRGGERAKLMAQRAESDPGVDAGNVEQLYRLCFCRLPDHDELDTCLAHLNRGRQRGRLQDAYEDLIWALINSKEFVFNH
jgi:hypothetical protein